MSSRRSPGLQTRIEREVDRAFEEQRHNFERMGLLSPRTAGPRSGRPTRGGDTYADTRDNEYTYMYVPATETDSTVRGTRRGGDTTRGETSHRSSRHHGGSSRHDGSRSARPTRGGETSARPRMDEFYGGKNSGVDHTRDSLFTRMDESRSARPTRGGTSYDEPRSARGTHGTHGGRSRGPATACLTIPNLYSVLGVSRDATADDIKKSYRKLCMQWHPDRVGSTMKTKATDKMAEINLAHDVLSDAKSRAFYDKKGRIPDACMTPYTQSTSFR